MFACWLTFEYFNTFSNIVNKKMTKKAFFLVARIQAKRGSMHLRIYKQRFSKETLWIGGKSKIFRNLNSGCISFYLQKHLGICRIVLIDASIFFYIFQTEFKFIRRPIIWAWHLAVKVQTLFTRDLGHNNLIRRTR